MSSFACDMILRLKIKTVIFVTNHKERAKLT